MENRKRRRSARVGAVERADWVRRLERSGQSALSFAREHDLSAHSLGRWRRQARAAGAEPGKGPVADFHTVSLAGATSLEWAAEVELGGEIRVRIRTGVPGSWVRELVEALR